MRISHNEVRIFFIFYLGTRPRNYAPKASNRAVGKAGLLGFAWQLRPRRLDILQSAAHHMPPPPKKQKQNINSYGFVLLSRH